MRSASLFLLCAGLAGAASGAGLPGPDDRLQLQVTSEVSTGSLDEPSGIPVRQSTLSLRYRAERWTAQVELPWRHVAGLQGFAAPQAPGSRSAHQGFGQARMTLVLPLRQSAPQDTNVDLVLRVQGGSGTAVGGVDLGNAGQSMRLAARRAVGDWNLFGSMGWRRAGDLPGTDPNRSAWQGELGLSRRFGSRIEAGGFADLRSRVAGEPALPEATLYAALNDGGRRWQVFVSRAFAQPFQDVSVGLTYRASF